MPESDNRINHTEVAAFGTTPDGTSVERYTVRSGESSASFINYGARLISLIIPDADGQCSDVVLGFSSLEDYIADESYQGAIVGRFGNRIAGGKFSLDGKTCQVPQNDGDNSLHGGAVGFDRKVWAATPIEDGVEFRLVSPDGDQGFPGTLNLLVRYTFVQNALRIQYEATCDTPTVINVTNHAYFNLEGQSSGSILNHQIQIPTDRYTPVSQSLIPTGELAPVEGTPFDFRGYHPIGQRIDEDNQQLQRTGGYDHNWAFGEPGALKTTARLIAGTRLLTVETTEPGMQFYSGNFLDGSTPDRVGGRYQKRAGLCLETQHYPDSPNQPGFPSTTLAPGDTMHSTTVYTFSKKL